MKDLVLSIITISAFDSERLSKTLDSLVGLPSSAEHIIVTPEGDSDSKNLWESHKFSSENKLLLVHDQNTGVYAAMNVGALAASGKYLCFWNAGDRLNTRKDLINLIETLRSMEPVWAISQGLFEWRSYQELTLANLSSFVTHVPDAFISHQTIYVAKETFLEIGLFDKRFRVAADTAQITKLFSKQLPIFEQSVVVQVETPNFASKNHRRARLEVLVIALGCLKGFQKIQASLNIIRNEIARFTTK